MYRFIAKRLLVAIPTLLIISVFVFSLQKLLPGDPVLAMAGEERDPQVLEFLREKYHLNDPVPYQYFYWLGSALKGDLGISLRTNQPVLELVAEKLPVTIQLAIMSMIFAFVIGVPMGILAAVKKNTIIDYLANIIALSGLSIPNFWLGIMLILLISVNLGWLPASGYEPFLQSAALDRNHDHALLRARQCARRHLDAPHPFGHAERPERRLYPHGPRQGAAGEFGGARA
jgi:peptide/nickel transport system permease protein